MAANNRVLPRAREHEQNAQEEAPSCPVTFSGRPSSCISSSCLSSSLQHTGRLQCSHASVRSLRRGPPAAAPSQDGPASPPSPHCSAVQCLTRCETPLPSPGASMSSSDPLPVGTRAPASLSQCCPASSSFAVLGFAGESSVGLRDRVVLLLLLSSAAASPHFFRHSLTTFQLYFSKDPALNYSDFFHGLLLSLVELPAIPASLFAGIWNVACDPQDSGPRTPGSGSYLPPVVTSRVFPCDSPISSSYPFRPTTSAASSPEALEAPGCQDQLPPSVSPGRQSADVSDFSFSLTAPSSSLPSRCDTPLRDAVPCSLSTFSRPTRCTGAARQLLLYAFVCWFGQLLFAVSIACFAYLPGAGISIIIAGAGGGGLVVLQRAAITALFPHAPTAAMAVSVACGALAKTVGRLGPALAVAALSASTSSGRFPRPPGQHDSLSRGSLVEGKSSFPLSDGGRTSAGAEKGESSSRSGEWREQETACRDYRLVVVAAVVFNGLSVLAAMGVASFVKRLLRTIGREDTEEEGKDELTPCSGRREVRMTRTSRESSQDACRPSRRRGSAGLSVPLLTGCAGKEDESAALTGVPSFTPFPRPDSQSWISVERRDTEEDNADPSGLWNPRSGRSPAAIGRRCNDSEGVRTKRNNEESRRKNDEGQGLLADRQEGKEDTSFLFMDSPCSFHLREAPFPSTGRRKWQERRRIDLRRRATKPPPPSLCNQPEVGTLDFPSTLDNASKPDQARRYSGRTLASSPSWSASDGYSSPSTQTACTPEVPRCCDRPGTVPFFSRAFLKGKRKRLACAEKKGPIPLLRRRPCRLVSSEAEGKLERKEKGRLVKAVSREHRVLARGLCSRGARDLAKEGRRAYALSRRTRKEDDAGTRVDHVSHYDCMELQKGKGQHAHLMRRHGEEGQGEGFTSEGQQGWVPTGQEDRRELLAFGRQAAPRRRVDWPARLAALFRKKNQQVSAKAKQVLETVDKLRSWKFGALVLLHAMLVAVGHCFLAFSSSIFFRVYKASMLHAAAFAALITVTTIVVLPAVAYLVDRTKGNLPLVAVGMLLIWLVLCGTIALQPSVGSSLNGRSAAISLGPRAISADSTAPVFDLLTSSSSSSVSPAADVSLETVGDAFTGTKAPAQRSTLAGEQFVRLAASTSGVGGHQGQATAGPTSGQQLTSEELRTVGTSARSASATPAAVFEARVPDVTAPAPSEIDRGGDRAGQRAGREAFSSQSGTADDVLVYLEVQERRSLRPGVHAPVTADHRAPGEHPHVPWPVRPSAASVSRGDSFASVGLGEPIAADEGSALPTPGRLEDNSFQEISRQARGRQTSVPLGIGGVLRGRNNRNGENVERVIGEGKNAESVFHPEAEDSEEGRWAVLAALLLGLAEALLPTVLMALVADPDIAPDPALYGVAFGVMEVFKCIAVAGVDATFGLIVDWQRGSYVGGLWFLCSLVVLAVVPLGTLLFAQNGSRRGEGDRPAAHIYTRGHGCHGAALLLRSFSPASSPRHGSYT